MGHKDGLPALASSQHWGMRRLAGVNDEKERYMNNLTLTEHAKSKSCPFRMEAECHGSYCMAWMQTTELSGFCGLVGNPELLVTIRDVFGGIEDRLSEIRDSCR